MKLDAVVARVAPDDPDRDRVKRAVLETIAALGFHLGRDGEICDPRPAPAYAPEQRRARWTGSGRRR